MSWKGAAFGAGLGFVLGHSWFSAIFCAVLGHDLEERWKRSQTGSRRRRPAYGPSRGPGTLVFLASAGAMFAKMAKADGAVTQDEIESVERAFARLGFDPAARRYAVNAFRKAKDDEHTIYEYAREFARAVPSVEVREVFYGLLWDLARADGSVSPEERSILRGIPAALGIRGEWYAFYDEPEAPRDTLAEAYATLGVSERASDADVRRAYREMAKKCHPDALRAQGLPDEMVGKATERMKAVNAAWGAIKAARGL